MNLFPCVEHEDGDAEDMELWEQLFKNTKAKCKNKYIQVI